MRNATVCHRHWCCGCRYIVPSHLHSPQHLSIQSPIQTIHVDITLAHAFRFSHGRTSILNPSHRHSTRPLNLKFARRNHTTGIDECCASLLSFAFDYIFCCCLVLCNVRSLKWITDLYQYYAVLLHIIVMDKPMSMSKTLVSIPLHSSTHNNISLGSFRARISILCSFTLDGTGRAHWKWDTFENNFCENSIESNATLNFT